jgi:eukaryotic-like serine/threonine-protein kinase
MTTDQLFADRYRLERRLGAGGMATVQLAFDTRLQRYVAVKLLAEHLADDANFSARFRREALAAARLVHPNIVQVFDFGSDDATHRQFIVMEYVDGGSCAEILRDRGAIEPEQAVDILVQSCRGLEYAHRNGVVHRDVKPGNLLVNNEGTVKLADFGIAKAAEQSDITKVGSVIGTAAYLAPEVSRGEPAGPGSDLYALGVVAYQLLTARLPYEGASLTDLARLQEQGPPPRPEGVPPALAEAILKALEREPEDRYASGTEMEEALENALHGVAPERTAHTRALREPETRAIDATEATRAIQSQPRRRQLEPLDEPPRRREPARRQAPVPAARRKKKSSGMRWMVGLVVLLALAAIAFGAYQALSDTSTRAIDLREEVRGNLDAAIDELRGLIEDNTQ